MAPLQLHCTVVAAQCEQRVRTKIVTMHGMIHICILHMQAAAAHTIANRSEEWMKMLPHRDAEVNTIVVRSEIIIINFRPATTCDITMQQVEGKCEVD